MSAMTPIPRHTRDTDHSMWRTVAESFWAVVALGIGLLLFFLVAGGPSIVTWQVSAVAVLLIVLWALHSRSVRRHIDDVHHDERWRHARERRGF